VIEGEINVGLLSNCRAQTVVEIRTSQFNE